MMSLSRVRFIRFPCRFPRISGHDDYKPRLAVIEVVRDDGFPLTKPDTIFYFPEDT